MVEKIYLHLEFGEEKAIYVMSNTEKQTSDDSGTGVLQKSIKIS